MALPVAIQLYSLRDEMDKDFKGTLEKVKEMGYDGVEFAGLYDHKPEEIKALVDELGLIPISAHGEMKSVLHPAKRDFTCEADFTAAGDFIRPKDGFR